jgi:hypothetical protein
LTILPWLAKPRLVPNSNGMPPVGAPKDTDVAAFAIAGSRARTAAPSTLANANRLPPPSTTAIHSGVPISLDFATAPRLRSRLPHRSTVGDFGKDPIFSLYYSSWIGCCICCLRKTTVARAVYSCPEPWFN